MAMTTSILLHSPSPSPSPASIPLPALQTDGSSSSSSSSSASGSCLNLHRTSSAPSRRIRFAPLPDPRRDFDDDDSGDNVHKSPARTHPAPDDLPDDVVALSPSVSPVSTLSSAHSTPTIRVSTNTPPSSQKLNTKIFRPFSFLRASPSASPNHSSPSSSLPRTSASFSTSLPNSPSFQSAKLPRFLTEDFLTLGTKSFFRARAGSSSSARPLRTSSPPPRSSDHSRSPHRSASTASSPHVTQGNIKRSQTDPSTHSYDSPAIAGSSQKKRRPSSSASTPGAGGGRHTSSVKLPNDLPRPRPSTAPSLSVTAPKKHVKMLNGRVYGAKRYAAQTLANPFANVREEPEFVEWGYGGMGSVHASAGIANDMWKGLQRSERGGALLAGSSFGSPSELTSGAIAAGGSRGNGTTSPTARRKMSTSVPECSMGNVGAGSVDEDDGSGMGWVKRRRAEREAKARLEREAEELKKPQEGRKSGDSMDASTYASTASTTTSLTACTSVASSSTTPATSPLVSRSGSLIDLDLTSPTESRDFVAAISSVTSGQSHISKDEREHHVLAAVRVSANSTPSLSHALVQIGKHTDNGSSDQLARLSPVDTEETTSGNSFEEDVDDNEDDEAEDIRRKTALGAGVEKISRHVDVEAR